MIFSDPHFDHEFNQIFAKQKKNFYRFTYLSGDIKYKFSVEKYFKQMFLYQNVNF